MSNTAAQMSTPKRLGATGNPVTDNSLLQSSTQCSVIRPSNASRNTHQEPARELERQGLSWAIVLLSIQVEYLNITRTPASLLMTRTQPTYVCCLVHSHVFVCEVRCKDLKSNPSVQNHKIRINDSQNLGTPLSRQ